MYNLCYSLTDMRSISVLVYFDGVWDSSRFYDAYSIVGVIIPVDCSYMKLVEIIMRELKKSRLEFAITIQYQIMTNGPLVQVCNSSLHFYIEIKKDDPNLTKFPLCVNIENVAPNDENLMCLGNELTGVDNITYYRTIITHGSSNGCLDTFSNPILPTIEEMGSAICEYVKYPDKLSVT
ncbi:zinc finger protein [Forsythia ovata]|uniref:Zinc finger protein n=1 Tax=Forsythia ovata TaxID=205694 RepID=A0ABD1PM00_9LAMI